MAHFRLSEAPFLEPRYNVAPSQDIPVIREEEGGRRLAFLRWGLIPFWAGEEKIGYRMINARAETAPGTPAFRAAFRKRRCIIPAGGFYEWKKEGKSKRPYYIFRRDGNPMALAGLWEHWEDPEEKERVVDSCTILTAAANELLAKLHNRMPVILEPGDFDLWLDPQVQQTDRLKPLLQPIPSDALDLYPVSSYVNKPANEGPECIEPGKEE